MTVPNVNMIISIMNKGKRQRDGAKPAITIKKLSNQAHRIIINRGVIIGQNRHIQVYISHITRV